MGRLDLLWFQEVAWAAAETKRPGRLKWRGACTPCQSISRLDLAVGGFGSGPGKTAIVALLVDQSELEARDRYLLSD